VLVTTSNRRFLMEQIDDQLRGASGVTRGLQFGPRAAGGNPTGGGPFGFPGGTVPPGSTVSGSGTTGSVPSGSIPSGVAPGGTLPGGLGPRPRIDEGNRGTFSLLWVGVVEADDTVQRVIAPGLGPASEPVIDPAQARAAVVSAEPFDTGSGGPERFRIAAYAISGDRVAVIGLPLDKVDEASQQLVLALVAGALAMAVFMALLVSWVWRLGLRPIRRTTEAADAIRQGDRHHRVEEYSARTEAGKMASALNTMLDEQKVVEDGLRRFVGDASHELRSPLTSIHGYVELYRRGGLEDRDALDDAMRRIAQESGRMVGLVDDLLLLARLDQARPLGRDPVDVAMVLRDAASDAAATAPRRPITVEVTEPLVLDGDEHRLRQVVAAVVTNALVHTPASSAVVLRGVAPPGGGVVVEIADEGPGMPAEVAAHAFERFFRGDPARGRDGGGAGLGLAIVQSVVTNHGGRVELDTDPTRGTTVRLLFPAGGAADEGRGTIGRGETPTDPTDRPDRPDLVPSSSRD